MTKRAAKGLTHWTLFQTTSMRWGCGERGFYPKLSLSPFPQSALFLRAQKRQKGSVSAMLAFLDQIDEDVLETDVSVIGGGPAGITLALELAELGAQVVLLEGGGLAPPGLKELDLYKGEVSGREYPLQASRLRYFGGTTGHWGGWCRPLDDVDFRAKPHIEFSGWPIKRSELAPWYEPAHRWLEMPLDEYYRGGDSPFADQLLADDFGVTSRYFRFSPPTRYGVAYRDKVVGSQRVQCLLGANATSLERGPGNEINGVNARSLAGETIQVRSRRTVLAMGGIENARFLLNTNERVEGALGNHSD